MHLPIMIRPSVGPALVVGGGKVATRKVQSLVEAGFEVNVVAPEVDPAIQGLAGVVLTLETFRPGHLARPALVFACTNSREVNGEVGRLARAHGIPVLVADCAEESTFTSPAVARRGQLTLAVSTGGTDPRRAREVRDRLADRLDAEALMPESPPGKGADE